MKEIKPKQWIRREDNTFSIPSQDFLNRLNREGTFENGCLYFRAENINVANTPQELVVKDDLIRTKYGCEEPDIEEVIIATGTDFICGDGYHIYFDDVIEILTPSSNGYDSQWKRRE